MFSVNLGWQQLPNEIKLLILNETDLSTLFNLAETEHQTHSLFYSEKIWEKHYLKIFERLDFKENIQIQFKIAYLYQLAYKSRPNKAQRLFKKILSLLDNFKEEKPWADYYYGVMTWSGKAVTVNRKIGFNYLVESLNKNDSRAALEIAKIILKENYLPDFITNASKNLMTKLIETLTSLHECHSDQATRLLVYLYQSGKTLSPGGNDYLVEKWLKQLEILNLETAIDDRLSFCQEKNSQEAYIKLLDQYAMKLPDSPVINYHLGSRYLNQLEEDNIYKNLAMTKLQHAVQINSDARYKLGVLYLQFSAEALDQETSIHWHSLAKQELKKAFEEQHMEAGNLLFQLLLQESIDNIEYFQKQLLLGNPIAANFIYMYYGENDEGLIDSEGILWLQLAAYYHAEAEELLESLSDGSNPFALLAMAILYETGIPGSTICEDLTLVNDYYLQAITIDPQIVSKYQDLIITLQINDPNLQLSLSNILLFSKSLDKEENMTEGHKYSF